MYIKRVKIANKKRFLLALILMALIVFRIGLSMLVFVDKKIDEKAFEKEQNFLSSFKKVEVVFEDGDTAWRIQEQLVPDEDTRVLLYYVKELNKDVNWGNIRPGESLIFLEKKEKD